MFADMCCLVSGKKVIANVVGDNGIQQQIEIVAAPWLPIFDAKVVLSELESQHQLVERLGTSFAEERFFKVWGFRPCNFRGALLV